MKKRALIFALVCAMALTVGLLTACGDSGETADSNGGEPSADTASYIGLLQYSNADEQLAKKMVVTRLISLSFLQEQGLVAFEGDEAPVVMTKEDASREMENINIRFYDTLTNMTMALESKDVSAMEVYRTVADYVCANNDKLEVRNKYDFNKIENEDARNLLIENGAYSDGFSFMLMKDSADLRDELNSTIKSMKEDGTLDQLVRDHIDAAIDGTEIKAIDIPRIDGADTIKVGVTGDLPPMDYISADGTPAGFNTAVLAEISKRLNRNIELVSIDSAARATALSSGNVDVVFWTRAQVLSDQEEDVNARTKKLKDAGMDEETITALNKMIELNEEMFPVVDRDRMDAPDGTIKSDPYYTDVVVLVSNK